MPSLKSVALVTIPLVAALAAYITPIITILGLFREIAPINNGKCVAIKGESLLGSSRDPKLTPFSFRSAGL